MKIKRFISLVLLVIISVASFFSSAYAEEVKIETLTTVVIMESPDYNILQQAAAVWKEAEEYDRKDKSIQSKIHTKERYFASKGNTTGDFGESMFWIEWDLDVPENGEYKIVFRFATGWDKLKYFRLSLDGIDSVIQLPGTGGWGGSPAEYRDVVVEEVRSLEKGVNTLRFQNIFPYVTLDWVGLVSIKDEKFNKHVSDNSESAVTLTEDYTSILITENLDYSVHQSKAAVWAEGEAFTDNHWEAHELATEIDGRDRLHASGGQSTNAFSWPDQWLEWKLDVPKDGSYNIVLRYATARDYNSLYRFYLGDKEMVVGLPFTYGWGNIAEDYRDVTIINPVELKAGENTLRMENILPMVNIDWIGLTPADTQKESPFGIIIGVLVALIAGTLTHIIIRKKKKK